MRKLLPLLLIPCILFTTGCPVLVVGGAGAGAYSYIKGELKRTYQSPFDKTMQASLDTLENLKITVTEQPAGDSIESIVRAKRSDGTPIIVKVAMVAPNITEVSIRSGAVGIWDKKVSQLIHANIAQRLQ